MPNRILKESICRSEEIDSLSWFEEVLFYRLIVNCDDYGRFDARIKIIKSCCFPLKDITEKDIEKALNKLSAVGLVRVYEAQGRPIMQLVTWELHQRIRNKKSKYPEYTGNDISLSIDSNSLTNADNCVRNPIQSESKSEIVPNGTARRDNSRQADSSASPDETDVKPELPLDDKDPGKDAFIELPLVDHTNYPVHEAYVRELEEAYPAVDVRQELREMRQWLNANPKNRKTLRGIKRFITHWLGQEQDKAPRKTGKTQNGARGNQFTNFPQRDYDYDALEAKLFQQGGRK